MALANLEGFVKIRLAVEVGASVLEINADLRIPDSELHWTFVRASGPGGQNVNKVASKAVLRWNLADSPSVPPLIKERVRSQAGRNLTVEGDLLLVSQRFRDQVRNRQDCLDKLRALLLRAVRAPKARKKTRPTASSQMIRLRAKQHRAAIKKARREPVVE